MTARGTFTSPVGTAGSATSAGVTATANDVEPPDGVLYMPGEVTWSSSNTSVATIRASGLVTAGAAGSATISVTSAGVTATATLTVVPSRNNP